MPGDTWIDAGDLLGEGVGLLFTDRGGGVSPSPYATLNLAVHTGDVMDNVARNRLRVARSLGMPPWDFTFLEQVHGLRVVEGERGSAATGARTLPAADGVFTAETGLALAVLTADCLPLALAVPSAGMVALLHAGWRGTLGDIAARALRAMRDRAAFAARDVRAVMGPAIGPCCYRVDEGRARAFVEKYGESSKVVGGEGGRRLDLFRANALNLVREGVEEAHIHRVGGCTCCERRFFSYRRDGVTGRQGAFIYLRERREARMMALARAHVVVSGRVQGVYYRAYAGEEARALGIRGWVRNIAGGRVEAVLEGDEEAVRRMIAWCRRGSPASRVEKVETTWEEPRGESEPFHVAYRRGPAG